jgi:hypothetical protein
MRLSFPPTATVFSSTEMATAEGWYLTCNLLATCPFLRTTTESVVTATTREVSLRPTAISAGAESNLAASDEYTLLLNGVMRTVSSRAADTMLSPVMGVTRIRLFFFAL